MTNFILVKKNDVTNYRTNTVILTSQNLRYFCISSFSISDRENLRVLNFIQIYLFLLNWNEIDINGYLEV